MLVTFDNDDVSYFDVFALQDFLESVLECKVDIVTPGGLRPEMRDHILQEAVRVA